MLRKVGSMSMVGRIINLLAAFLFVWRIIKWLAALLKDHQVIIY